MKTLRKIALSPEVKKARLRLKALEKILKKHPEADRDNLWHTLVLLEQAPWERLKRGLLRAQKIHPY